MSIKQNIVTIDELLEKVSTYISDEKDLELIKKAYEFAQQKHFGQTRITGEDYIQHPLNVALILTGINADSKCIAAALLHDTIEDCEVTTEEIEDLFGSDVAMLVNCVTKINKIKFNSASEQMAANQRKILVGLSEDVRVIIIKLADRLHNMRTLYVLSEEKQKRKAKETLEILTPVAHRLGINKIKSELEDLSLRYLKPDAYYDIVEKLNKKKSERDESVGKMLNEVSDLLTEHNIKHEIKGRSKSIYSIYNKLNKGRKWEDIYDILALRVFVETEQECYIALGLIHSKYKPVPKRFKDYVAMPKTNLYQSLHTTVFGVDASLFEIQIRTYEMDKIAEYGIASHWSYKENKDASYANKDAMEQKLQIFRNIIELNNETSTPEEFINSIKKDILTDNSIYVYTPKGDVIELPEGATPVDFAYKVHSEVGNTMVGAIVNDSIVALNYKLKTGDIIRINTSKTAKGPNKDWLKFVATTQAKAKIKSFYSKINKEELITKGEALLEKQIRKNKLSITEVLTNKNLELLLQELKIKDTPELYTCIANGKYSSKYILNMLTGQNEVKEKKKIKENNIGNAKNLSKNEILVEGITDIKVSLSNCCKPISGDDIIGYITKGSGITIHRACCHNIVDVDERLIKVKWNEEVNKKYFTDLLIHTSGNDKLLDIITKASTNDITIDSVHTINKSEFKIYSITVMVANKENLDKFINDLYNIRQIDKVERVLK